MSATAFQVDVTNTVALTALMDELAVQQQAAFFSNEKFSHTSSRGEIPTEYHKICLFGRALNAEELQTCLTVCLFPSVTSFYFSSIKPTDTLEAAFCFYLRADENEATLNNIFEKLTNSINDVEVICYASAPRLKKPGLLVMDMDSTAIDIECIDEIAVLAGVGEQVSKVTASAMRGELDFAQSLIQRVATLKGTEQHVLQQVLTNMPLMEGVKSLVNTLKANGWKVAIASGGFTFFANDLKHQLGLDAAIANELEIINGVLTGKVTGQIVDANVKAQTIKQLAQQHGIPQSQTVAMGDGANDLVMMSAAQLGVAFHAKPAVVEKADIAFHDGGLDQLLYVLSS
ncbi:phosphoserine phosphatase SerB [Flocculibacter collagenilyticus]|uniref:phosphoserine phosphatase SerB n=1 Tax=Flocculibacter collagenilyticus TaxID=2744479 RepID=UPI001F3B20B6|nr:phosphoserine phosphatase SerB [Flocculibacter collagenilyticus]